MKNSFARQADNLATSAEKYRKFETSISFFRLYDKLCYELIFRFVDWLLIAHVLVRWLSDNFSAINAYLCFINITKSILFYFLLEFGIMRRSTVK